MPATDLILEPDIYSPIQNNVGEYVDKIPHIADVGIRCPCSATRRQPPTYKNSSAFIAHTKTQCHAKWLEELNNNRHNLVVENAELKDTVRTQKEIIGRLEIQVANKDHVIGELLQRMSIATTTAAVAPPQQLSINLLDV